MQRGREKHHYLNSAPIADIAGRWIGKYERGQVTILADLTQALEREIDERQ